MKFSFLGGAEEVGMAGILLETPEYRFLLDYGFTPGKPPSFPRESPNIDFCLLTHAHVDHSGLIPWLCSARGARIFATSATQGIAEILARDNLKVSKLEGYALPFSAADVETMRNYYETVGFEEKLELEGIDIRTHSSGHIPGSTMFEVNNGARTLITGDLNTVDSMLVEGVKPVKCDNLFIESTYAGREHPDRDELVKKFRDDVSDTAKRGGITVVPAFAVARSQEVLMMLDDLGIDLYLDGMSKRIATLFLSEGKFVRSAKKLKKALSRVKFVNNDSQRKRVLKNGGIVVTPSGMLDGGPALFYVRHIKDEEKNSVFLTGYQVEGSNGRSLMERGTMEFDGEEEKLKCNVKFFDFSAHADHKSLIRFIDDCKPETVVLYHGDKRELLANDLSNYNVMLPKDGVDYEIKD
jgi:putative mRNA 3-end processing factor